MLTRADKTADYANVVRFLRHYDLYHLAVLIEGDKGNHINGFYGHKNDFDKHVASFLDRHNGRSNLYVHINPLCRRPAHGKATKGDVDGLRLLAVDLDPPDDMNWHDGAEHQRWLQAEVAKLRSFEKPPSHINCSGWGLQAFWPLRDVVSFDNPSAAADCEARNKYLGERLGADKGVWSADRIWRIPNTWNVPIGKKAKQGRPRKQSYILQWDDGRRFSIEDFPLPPAPAIATLAAIARPSGEVPRHLDDRIRASEPGRRSEDFHAVVRGLADRGFSETAIEAELLRHPDGPAAKYVGRLSEEIRRSLSGWTPKTAAPKPGTPSIGHNEPPDEPIQLIRDMPPATPYPVDALGPIMASAVRAFHQEIQAPEAMCANSVLASAALAGQPHFDVEMPHGTAPISLYLASVAKSGERKTGVDKKVLKPVREFEAELRKDHEREQRNYLDHKEAWDANRKRTLGSNQKVDEKRQELKNLGPEPKAPPKPIRAVSDVTAEGLAGMLELVLSAGLFATEGGQFTGGHAMSDDAKLRNAAFFSRLWDEGYADRIRAREEAKIIPGRRLSLHLQLQPDVAFRFFSDPVLQDQGLHSRFLITFPDTTMGQRRYMPVLGPEQVTAQVRYAARIKELLRRKETTEEGNPYALAPKPLPLSCEAQEAFIEFVGGIEKELAPGGSLEPISGLANKLPEHAARIAAVIAVIENPQLEEIDADAMRGGIQLASHYAAEAHRITMMSQGQIELQDACKLWKWLDEAWLRQEQQSHISVPDIMQRGPGSIRDKQKAEELVQILVNHGYLKPDGRQVIGGKPRQQTWKIWGAGNGC